MKSIKQPYTDCVGLEKNFQALYGEIKPSQSKRYETLFSEFKKTYSVSEAYFASSSGRVEVCGNHTDHNGGRVVSCAVSLDTIAAFLPTDDDCIYIKSEGYSDISVDINGEETENKGTSAALVRGVVVAMRQRGLKVGGFKALLTSNVLGGAGISSSASFEVLVAEILNFLYNEDKIDAETKAKIAQYSENKYFGKPCGLLDQTAIAFGGLKRLDFANPEKICVTEIKNELKDYTLVLINTGGSHADLTDEYALIPKEMFSVAKAMGRERLIEVGKERFYEQLPTVYNELSDRAVLRAIHFFDENDRVDNVYEALNGGDYETFLSALNFSGKSSLYKLQNCFVAGSSEQPIPKAIAIAEKYLKHGAVRIHGGGFAGCILCVVKNDEINSFMSETERYFNAEDIIPLKVRSVGTIVL